MTSCGHNSLWRKNYNIGAKPMLFYDSLRKFAQNYSFVTLALFHVCQTSSTVAHIVYSWNINGLIMKSLLTVKTNVHYSPGWMILFVYVELLVYFKLYKCLRYIFLNPCAVRRRNLLWLVERVRTVFLLVNSYHVTLTERLS